jgi:hypothetical protein
MVSQRSGSTFRSDRIAAAPHARTRHAPPRHPERPVFAASTSFIVCPRSKTKRPETIRAMTPNKGLIGLEAAQISKRFSASTRATASRRSIGEKGLQLTSCNSPPLSASTPRDPRQIRWRRPAACRQYSLAFDRAARCLDRRPLPCGVNTPSHWTGDARLAIGRRDVGCADLH